MCGGEEVEVGVDFASAAHPGTASAVAAAHQVADLAFDFGAGGAVVVGPVGVVLVAAGGGEVLFVTADGDRAAGGRGGALGAQRTAGAGVGEVGDAVTGATSADRHGHPVGAGDGVVVKVDLEAVLGEQPAGQRRGGWVLQRDSMPLTARWFKNSPVP